MKVDLLGLKVEIIHIIIIVVLGVLFMHLFGGCVSYMIAPSTKEGMELLGSDVSYKMGEGVNGSWENKEQQQGPSLAFRQHNHDAYQSTFVGPDKSLNFFSDTDFAQECCGSNYSANGGLTDKGNTTGGCACMNKQQIEYLNARGGNRSSGAY